MGFAANDLHVGGLPITIEIVVKRFHTTNGDHYADSFPTMNGARTAYYVPPVALTK
jgi:hypothetical protein